MENQSPSVDDTYSETGFAHAIRGRGMRAFYSRLIFVDPNATLWTSWIMSVGASSLEPLFVRAFLYRHTDDRDGVAEELLKLKTAFKEFVVNYYEQEKRWLH